MWKVWILCLQLQLAELSKVHFFTLLWSQLLLACPREIHRCLFFVLITRSTILIGFIELAPSCYYAFQSLAILICLSMLLPTKAPQPSPSWLNLSHHPSQHRSHRDIGTEQRGKCVKSQSGCWSKFWHSDEQRGKWRKGEVNRTVAARVYCSPLHSSTL